MRKDNTTLIGLLSLAAIAGNILFILWITYNGINEKFQGTLPEKISYVGLTGLLLLNNFLLLRNKKRFVKQERTNA